MSRYDPCCNETPMCKGRQDGESTCHLIWDRAIPDWAAMTFPRLPDALPEPATHWTFLAIPDRRSGTRVSVPVVAPRARPRLPVDTVQSHVAQTYLDRSVPTRYESFVTTCLRPTLALKVGRFRLTEA